MEILTDNEDSIIIVDDDNNIVNQDTIVEDLIVEDKAPVIVVHTDVETVCVSSAGPQGPSGVLGELQVNTLIQPTETEIVDAVIITLVESVLWKITLTDKLTGLKRVTSVQAAEVLGSVDYSIGPTIGSRSFDLPYLITLDTVGAEVQLTVTNNHINPLTVQLLRIKTDSINF